MSRCSSKLYSKMPEASHTVWHQGMSQPLARCSVACCHSFAAHCTFLGYFISKMASLAVTMSHTVGCCALLERIKIPIRSLLGLLGGGTWGSPIYPWVRPLSCFPGCLHIEVLPNACALSLSAVLCCRHRIAEPCTHSLLLCWRPCFLLCLQHSPHPLSGHNFYHLS